MSIDVTDQTLQLIEKTKLEHGDAFRLKVLKKKSQTDLSPQTIAIFDDVTAQQVYDAELWLPHLAGGGIFNLVISSMKAVATKLGAPLAFNVTGPMTDVLQRQMLGDPSWKGPTNLISPTVQEAPATVVTLTGSLQQQRPVGPPVADPVAAAAAAAARDAHFGQAQSDVIRAQALLTESERRMTTAMQQEAELARQRAALEAEREEVRRKQQHSSESGSSMAMMLEFFKMAREDRAREDARAREERRADEERLRQREEADRARWAEMMASITKPDPIKEALIQKALAGGENHAKQMAESAAATMAMVNTVTGMTMQLMQTRVEMSQLEQGEQESPIYKLVGRGMDVLERVMEAKNPGMNGVRPEEEGAEGEGEEGLDVSDAQVVDGNALARFDAAIYAMKAPHICIPLFFEALQTKEFEEMYNRVKGDLQKIAEERYGAWVLKDVQKRHQYLTVVLPRCLQAAVVAGLIQEHSEPPKKKQATPTRSNAGSKKKNGAATSVEVEEAQVVPPVQASPEVETPEA